MLGVGWTEMLVIGVVALIVIGPKELPALMQKIGRFAGTVRRMGADFQRELNKTTGLDEVKNLRTAITQPLKATTDAIRKEFNTTTASGAVEPSGALKPGDPKAESVVKEIHAAAGMPIPAEPLKTAPVKIEHIETPAVATPVAATATTANPAKPIKSGPVTGALAKPAAKKPAAKRPVREKAATTPIAPSTASPPPSIPAAVPPATKARKRKAVESPAPAEALAPAAAATAKPKRRPAAKKA
jgi:sec-independent protein translocase protein TatB